PLGTSSSSLYHPSPVKISRNGNDEGTMIDKELELEKLELREKALSVREKAARARRMAARARNSPSTRALDLHAAEFEAKAAALDRDIEEIEEREALDAGSVTDWVSVRAREWRAGAEETRTAAKSMTSEPARHTLDRLARNYEAMAEKAE